MPKTKERHFEDAIEHHLLSSGGWVKGDPRDFNRTAAIVSKDFFAFVEGTQPDTWKELRKHHQTGLEVAVVDTLTKAIDSRGLLDVLRHGFKFFGKKIECAYFKPAHGMNPDILAEYDKNRLVVVRQVKFIAESEHSVDLVLFVNGFPVATAELKNPLTNQTVQDAIAQYRERDPRHRLFQFKKGALVGLLRADRRRRNRRPPRPLRAAAPARGHAGFLAARGRGVLQVLLHAEEEGKDHRPGRDV